MYIALPLALVGYAWSRFGRSFAALSSSLLFFGGIAVELLGTRTGLPFGSYSYTAAFQPQVLGVPLEIALGWLTLGLMSYSLATQGGLSRVWAVLLASFLMVAWDVLYDPVFVGLGMWVWREGTYFSVPISNFVGWFIVSLIFFEIISAARGPHNLPVEGISAFAPLTVYLSYVVDGCASNIFLGQALAGLVGGTLMVVIALAAYAPRLRSIGSRAQRNCTPRSALRHSIEVMTGATMRLKPKARRP
jgi:putative membrane protein